MASKNGTDGRVYGGDACLIHIADGEREKVGKAMAAQLSTRMRYDALESGRRTDDEAFTQDLCPGCYMIAGFNMLVQLAKRNGQSMKELCDTMAAAFTKLAECGDQAHCLEEITVILDT